MYVCHCRAITDGVIRAAIERGIRDEFDLAAVCGAGARCGGCMPLLRELLDDYCEDRSSEPVGTGVG